MKYATLCTGLGGFDLGFDQSGMECVYQCEQDRDCLRVLNRHWPDVPKSTDVNDGQTILDLVRLRPSIIAFGSPCQDLSVAGRRGGLAAERSGIFFRCVELCFACEAPWVVWENVPGVFSSQHGEDFASVLEAFTGFRPTVPENGWRNSGVCVGPLYSVAWAVLDAQWFGVPQSRDRVFLVGSLGDRAGPYEILSLAESVPWNPPPSREARPSIARCLATGTNPGRYDGDTENFVVGTLNSGGNNGGFRTEPGEHLVVSALDTKPYADHESKESRLVVTHALTASGFDASEDGTGRGTPIVPVDYTNGLVGHDLCGTLEAAQAKGNRGHGLIVPFDTTQITSKQNRSNPKPGAPCHPLSSSGHPPAIAFNHQAGGGTAFDLGANEEVTGALSASTTPAITYALSAARECGVGDAWRTTYLPLTKAVRRLTPLECERLQGFPDGWSRFGADGKQIADSPRYRMLGNAVNVRVAEYIGRQLAAMGRLGGENVHDHE